MTYEMTGTIKKIGDLQTFPSGFEKRELLLNDEDPRFPQDIAFSFTRDRTKLLDQFAEGERAKVSFDIRCREFNDRHYIDLNAWRIERPADASPAAGKEDRHPEARQRAERSGTRPHALRPLRKAGGKAGRTALQGPDHLQRGG